MGKRYFCHQCKGVNNRRFIRQKGSIIGAFAMGVAAIFGIYKYIKNLSVTNELLYGDEARERYNHIKDKKVVQLETLRYGGGAALTVPRLEIRKISSSSRIVSKDWKNRRAIVKFYEDKGEDEKGKIIQVERWLI